MAKSGVDNQTLVTIQQRVERIPPSALQSELQKNLAALKSQPKNAALHFGVGMMFSRAGDQINAVSMLEQALKLARDNEIIIGALAFIHATRIGDHASAVKYLEKRHRLNRRDGATLLLLANSYLGTGNTAKALEALDKAVGLVSGNAEIKLHAMRSQCFQRMGDFDSARKELLQVSEIAPTGLISVADVLSRLPGNSPELQGQLEMEMTNALAEKPDLFRDGFHRGMAAVALGNIHENRKEYDKAFEYFEQANQFQDSDENAWSKDETREFEILKGTFTKELFEDLPPGHSSEKQVFIVGMPRSGTTLLESILGSHPLIEDHGELEFFNQQQYMIGITSIKNPDVDERISAVQELLRSAPADGLSGIGDGYLRRHGFNQRPTTWKVDKMPHNFRCVGLIASVFPKARIVHARRHPMDVCLSNFKTLLLGQNTTFGQSLEKLGDYYLEYANLMRHWQSVLPIPVHEVRYEDMISDTETKARELVEFVGADWDPACLENRASKRDVNTASMWQVRQGIYNSSVEKWRAYEKQLTPLQGILKEEIACYEAGE